jgi:hypothetical protein
MKSPRQKGNEVTKNVAGARKSMKQQQGGSRRISSLPIEDFNPFDNRRAVMGVHSSTFDFKSEPTMPKYILATENAVMSSSKYPPNIPVNLTNE